MKNQHIMPWIEKGYEIFAFYGPDEIKVERLARETGISKSSFYHHFADLQVFEEYLLDYHFDRATKASEKARKCERIDPDFLELILEEKEYVLFTRQLKHNFIRPGYKACDDKANTMVLKNYLDIWAEMLQLSDHKPTAFNILLVVNDMFYQRISAQTLNRLWLDEFLKEIKNFLTEVVRAYGLTTSARLL